MREDVILALVAVLEAAGFKVRRDTSLDGLSARSLPCVILSDNGREEIYPKIGGFVDVNLHLEMQYVLAKSSNQSTALNNFDVSVLAAITTDQTLGGLVAAVIPMPQSNGETSGADHYATRTRPVRIFYESTIGAL